MHRTSASKSAVCSLDTSPLFGRATAALDARKPSATRPAVAGLTSATALGWACCSNSAAGVFGLGAAGGGSLIGGGSLVCVFLASSNEISFFLHGL
eukprot:5457924-Prymnesium_polylepis.1